MGKLTEIERIVANFPAKYLKNSEMLLNSWRHERHHAFIMQFFHLKPIVYYLYAYRKNDNGTIHNGAYTQIERVYLKKKWLCLLLLLYRTIHTIYDLFSTARSYTKRYTDGIFSKTAINTRLRSEVQKYITFLKNYLASPFIYTQILMHEVREADRDKSALEDLDRMINIKKELIEYTH